MDQTKAGVAQTVDTGTRHRRLRFRYDRDWIASEGSFAISPEMPLDLAPHEPPVSRYIPWAFDDASPDRWGRDLINAEHRRHSKLAGTRWQPLDEVGLLLSVNDETRQGALRFRMNGTFLAEPTPKARISDLSDLRDAARQFEKSGEIDASIEHLLGVASSPGGAAPKSWVHDEHDEMWLAKFPRFSDSGDVSAWELVAINLQREAGIEVQPSQILRLNEFESIFLTKRFDRDGDRRKPYQSFKTMFRLDEQEHKNYAALSREISRISSDPTSDGQQLFSRAAFGVMVNNIDDHMRNHGLVHAGVGWRLAPSFDVNPEPRGFSDTPLTPDDDPTDPDLRLLIAHAEDFLLTEEQAKHRLANIASVVDKWPVQAKRAGIETEAIDSMAKAFTEKHRDLAKSLSVTNRANISRGHKANSDQVWVKPHTRSGRHIAGHWRRRDT